MDTVIQRSLRTNLGPEVTLFTIAHMLQTVMDAEKNREFRWCNLSHLMVLTDRS